MDYSTLVADKSQTGSIQYWINYARIDSAGILTEAEAWIYSKLRVSEMRATDNVALASGVSVAPFPDGYLDPIHFGIPGHMPTIPYKDEASFKLYAEPLDETGALPTGIPTLWTDLDSQINLNVLTDAAYTAKMAFYKTPTALSDTNETNFLTRKYPTLLRRTCLMFAAEARKEYSLMDRNELKALQAIEQARQEDDLKMRGWLPDFNWSEGN